MRLRSRSALVQHLDVSDLSERELARRCGLAHATINHLVTGRRESCTARTALLIELTLGAQPTSLFSPQSESDYAAVAELRVLNK